MDGEDGNGYFRGFQFVYIYNNCDFPLFSVIQQLTFTLQMTAEVDTRFSTPYLCKRFAMLWSAKVEHPFLRGLSRPMIKLRHLSPLEKDLESLISDFMELAEQNANEREERVLVHILSELHRNDDSNVAMRLMSSEYKNIKLKDNSRNPL